MSPPSAPHKPNACLRCGEPRGRRYKYCSNKCSRLARYERNPRRARPRCSECGATLFKTSEERYGTVCRKCVERRPLVPGQCKGCGAATPVGVGGSGHAWALCLACDPHLKTGMCKYCGVETFGRHRPRVVCDAPDCQARSHRRPTRGGLPDPNSIRRRKALDRDGGGLNDRQLKDLLHRWQRRGIPCLWCGKSAESVDHLIPVSRGGTNYEGNLAPACRFCNGSRSNRLLIEWRRRTPGGPRTWPQGFGRRSMRDA